MYFDLSIPDCQVQGWRSWRKTKRRQLEAKDQPTWQYPRDRPQMQVRVLTKGENQCILLICSTRPLSLFLFLNPETEHWVYLPESATSLTALFVMKAMWPSKENIANPAKTLVLQFMMETIRASLKWWIEWMLWRSVFKLWLSYATAWYKWPSCMMVISKLTWECCF